MKQMILNSALVGIGGFVGSISRYGLAILLQRHSVVMPAGTLAANLAGCFVIGCIAQLAAPAGFLSPEMRLLLATGFCGGFTTLSSAIYELAQFWKEGEYLYAGGYLTLTLVGSVALFYGGGMLIKLLFKTTGGIWN
jgi:fluoride exporter